MKNGNKSPTGHIIHSSSQSLTLSARSFCYTESVKSSSNSLINSPGLDSGLSLFRICWLVPFGHKVVRFTTRRVGSKYTLLWAKERRLRWSGTGDASRTIACIRLLSISLLPIPEWFYNRKVVITFLELRNKSDRHLIHIPRRKLNSS